MKPDKPTLAQKRLQARRLKITEAAVACFIDNGYHQTGVREIAERAGVSIGNLYNHFKNKDEILLEITAIEAVEISEFVEILQASQDPVKVFHRFTKTYLAYCIQPENALITLELLSVALRNPLVSAGFEQNRILLINALADLLSGAEFRQFADPTEPARLVLDLIEGMALRGVWAGKRPSKSAKQTLFAMLDNALMRH